MADQSTHAPERRRGSNTPTVYVKVQRTIWNDSEFRRLSQNAQWVYLALISSPVMTKTGVIRVTGKQLAVLCGDGTPERLTAGLTELADQRFVYIDYLTDEVLVRSYMKYDGNLTNLDGTTGCMRAATLVTSEMLREIVYELIVEQAPKWAETAANKAGVTLPATARATGRTTVPATGRSTLRRAPMNHEPSSMNHEPDSLPSATQETDDVNDGDIDGQPSADFVGDKLEGKELRDAIWEALATITGTKPATPTERSLHGKAVTEIIEAGGDHIDVIAKAEVWKSRFPGLKITVPALLKHWSSLGTFRPNTTWCGKPAYIDPNFEPTDWVPNPNVHFADGSYIDGATNAKMAAYL